MSRDSQRIRELNDDLRQSLAYSPREATTTEGILNLGILAMYHIVKAVGNYDDFTKDNDPWEEHDFGQLNVNGQSIIWRIDYFPLTGLKPPFSKRDQNSNVYAEHTLSKKADFQSAS